MSEDDKTEHGSLHPSAHLVAKRTFPSFSHIPRVWPHSISIISAHREPLLHFVFVQSHLSFLISSCQVPSSKHLFPPESRLKRARVRFPNCLCPVGQLSPFRELCPGSLSYLPSAGRALHSEKKDSILREGAHHSSKMSSSRSSALALKDTREAIEYVQESLRRLQIGVESGERALSTDSVNLPHHPISQRNFMDADISRPFRQESTRLESACTFSMSGSVREDQMRDTVNLVGRAGCKLTGGNHKAR